METLESGATAAGSAVIDAEHINRARAALGHTWETAAIVCLGAGPLPFARLSRSMRAWSTDEMPEGTLCRTLSSLRGQGLINVSNTRGRKSWQLTDAGNEKFLELARIANAIHVGAATA